MSSVSNFRDLQANQNETAIPQRIGQTPDRPYAQRRCLALPRILAALLENTRPRTALSYRTRSGPIPASTESIDDPSLPPTTVTLARLPDFAGGIFVGGTSTVTAQQNTDRQLAEQYLNSSEFEKAAELYDRLFDKDPFSRTADICAPFGIEAF